LLAVSARDYLALADAVLYALRSKPSSSDHSRAALALAQPSTCLSLTGRVDLVGLVYQAAQVPRPELSALDGEPGACGWLTAAAVLAGHGALGVVGPDLLQQALRAV